MVTAVIFRSFMAGKCTQRVPLRMTPNPGVPLLITMTWTNSGVTVEVKIFLLIVKKQQSIIFINQIAVIILGLAS